MKRLFTLTLIVLVYSCLNAAFAQGSHKALGLRFNPNGAGFTGKFFTNPRTALEVQLNAYGISGGGDKSITVVGLYEYHIPLNQSWRLYLGAGAHLGAWDHSWVNDGRWRDGNEPILGIDGIAGIEYVFRKAPIGLSVDIKPAVNFISNVGYLPHNTLGLGVRLYL